MNSISRLWYHLTAYIPRRLPATPSEFARFKHIMIFGFGLPDEPAVWALVSGQISSHNPHRLRMPWGHIANAAKKIRVMNLAQEFKQLALKELNTKLEAATARHAALLQGLDKLFDDNPELYAGALDGEASALKTLAGAAAERFPEQGADEEQWIGFIRSQAVEKNVAQMKKEAHDTSSEKLKEADAEPGPKTDQTTEREESAYPAAQGFGQRRGRTGRAGGNA